MSKLKPTTSLLVLLFCFCVVTTHAQSEYFVEIDPSTGNFNKISRIPGVNWINPGISTYDELHHLYFFSGSADAKNWQLYTINALTGEVLNSPLISFPDTLSSINNLHYSSTDNIIYCIHYNGLEKNLFFATLNPITAEYKDVKEVSGPKYGIGYSTIDNNNQLVYSIVPDFDTLSLYTFEIKSGNVINKTTVPSSINNIIYNNKTKKLIGFYSKRDSTTSIYSQFLVSIDPKTGSMNIINKIPDVSYLLGLANNYVINETTNEFTAVLFDSYKIPRLYTFNIDSGMKINDPAFYQVRNDSDNIICFQFDNQLGKLFGIHWESRDEHWQDISDSVIVYPNPFTDETVLNLRKSYRNIRVNLFNNSGKYISTFYYANVPNALIRRNGLPSGIYYAIVYNNFGYLGTTKLVAR